MTERLTSSPAEKERALRWGLILGLVFMVPGAAAFVFSNSVTILADFLVSTVETVAVFFSWYAIRQAIRGKDFNFNYGYGKLEALASLVVTLALGLSFVGILFGAWYRLGHPTQIEGWGVAVSAGLNAFALTMNSRQWLRCRRLHREAPSPVLDGQVKLFRNKLLSSLCVLSILALSFALASWPWSRYLDPIGSLVLSGFLIQSAVGLFNVSLTHLLDKTLEEPLQMEIMQVLARHFERYRFLHDVRSRRSGGDTYIELFMEFEPDMPIRETMEVVLALTRDLRQRIPGSHVNVILADGTVEMRGKTK